MAAPILVISYDAPPRLTAQSVMTLKTLRALASSASGLVIDLVCAPGGDQFGVDPRLEDLLPENLRVHRVDPFGSGRKTILQRIIGGKGGWQTAAAEKCAALFPATHKKPELIYSRSHPPASHLAALELVTASMEGVPWIAHFSEPWSRNPSYRGSMTKAALAKYEQQIFEKAARLIFPSNEIRDLMLDGASDDVRAKARVLPPIADVPLFAAESRVASPLVQRNQGIVRVGHIGTLTGARSPAPILAGLQQFIEEQPHLAKRLEFHQIGLADPEFFSEEVLSMPSLREAMNLSPPVSYAESLAAMEEMDALLAIDTNARHSVTFPTKLIDYFMAQKPIIGCAPKDSYITRVLSGWEQTCCDLKDQDAIVSAFENAVDGRLPKPPDLTLLKRFAADNAGKELRAMLIECGVHV